MGDLFLALLPEMIGLVITPGAIVACLLLLDSARPARNVGGFALGFVAFYLVLAVVVLAAGSVVSPQDKDTTVRSWVGVVVGVLFLLGGLVSLLRRPHADRPSTPGWAKSLEDPSLRTVMVAGIGLSVLNPNVAILLSGLSAVVASGVSVGGQVAGVALLLGACALDFVVPGVVYLASGERGRARLGAAKDFLLRHNRMLGVVVLLVFGVLFTVRGLVALL